MKVEINNTRGFRISEVVIRNLFSVVAKVQPKFSKKCVSVALVDNLTIKKLNKKYRHKNSVTDVLSFGEDTKSVMPQAEDCLGEIIIAYPRMLKQAKMHKHSVQTEMVILLVHGCLHLLGYDHITKNDNRKMNRMAVRIVQRFNLIK